MNEEIKTTRNKDWISKESLMEWLKENEHLTVYGVIVELDEMLN